MRKIFLFSLLLILSATAFGQQINPSSALTKQDYLQKNKRQKTAAKTLLGGGFLSFGLGFATIGGKQSNSVDNGIMMVAGAAAVVASVPFFISASKNKKKAMNMSLKSQMVPQVQGTGFINRAVPSLHLKISI